MARFGSFEAMMESSTAEWRSKMGLAASQKHMEEDK